MSKIDNEKAALVAALTKNHSSAKTVEAKLEILLGAIDVGESYVAHARGLMHETLKDSAESVFELGGLPYKRVTVRGTGGEGQEPRYALRCGITREVRERYQLAKKA